MSLIRDIPYRVFQLVHTYSCQPLSCFVEITGLSLNHTSLYRDRATIPSYYITYRPFLQIRTNFKPQYHTLSIHKGSCILPSSLRELSTTSNCRPENTATNTKMRPGGPRDPVAGPDAGPEPPFPIKLFGPVIRGFGRGSKEVRESSILFRKFRLSHSTPSQS